MWSIRYGDGGGIADEMWRTYEYFAPYFPLIFHAHYRIAYEKEKPKIYPSEKAKKMKTSQTSHRHHDTTQNRTHQMRNW